MAYAHVNSTSCTACHRRIVATRSALSSQSAWPSMSGSLWITPFFRRSIIDGSRSIYISSLLHLRVLPKSCFVVHVDLSNHHPRQRFCITPHSPAYERKVQAVYWRVKMFRLQVYSPYSRVIDPMSEAQVTCYKHQGQVVQNCVLWWTSNAALDIRSAVRHFNTSLSQYPLAFSLRLEWTGI